MTCRARRWRRSPRRNCASCWGNGRTATTDREYLSVIASASEAIHAATKQEWIASSQVLLAMTALGQMKIRERRHVGPRQSTYHFHGVVPPLAGEPCLCPNRRHGPLQLQNPHRRRGFFVPPAAGDRARPGAGVMHDGGEQKTRRRKV